MVYLYKSNNCSVIFIDIPSTYQLRKVNNMNHVGALTPYPPSAKFEKLFYQRLGYLLEQNGFIYDENCKTYYRILNNEILQVYGTDIHCRRLCMRPSFKIIPLWGKCVSVWGNGRELCLWNKDYGIGNKDTDYNYKMYESFSPNHPKLKRAEDCIDVCRDIMINDILPFADRITTAKEWWEHRHYPRIRGFLHEYNFAICMAAYGTEGELKELCLNCDGKDTLMLQEIFERWKCFGRDSFLQEILEITNKNLKLLEGKRLYPMKKSNVKDIDYTARGYFADHYGMPYEEMIAEAPDELKNVLRTALFQENKVLSSEKKIIFNNRKFEAKLYKCIENYEKEEENISWILAECGKDTFDNDFAYSLALILKNPIPIPLNVIKILYDVYDDCEENNNKALYQILLHWIFRADNLEYGIISLAMRQSLKICSDNERVIKDLIPNMKSKKSATTAFYAINQAFDIGEINPKLVERFVNKCFEFGVLNDRFTNFCNELKMNEDFTHMFEN